MQTMTKHKSDAEIQKQVLQELAWDPRVDETEVGVQVKDGIVTLTGKIPNFGKRLAASDAAHRVVGVLDVANDLEVVLPGRDGPSDTEIAAAVRDALKWNVFVHEKDVATTVSNGWVTLTGHVSDWFQKESASKAVRDLAGVRGVTNRITVRAAKVDSVRVRSAIEDALARQAEREAKRLKVQVENGVVTLTGTVRSWSERNAVEKAAGYAPGVVEVHDELFVDSYS